MGSGINLGIIRNHEGNENYLIEVGKNIDVKNVSTFSYSRHVRPIKVPWN